MLTQLYTAVFPFVRVLRRLLAEGVPIGDIPVEIAHMEADGDIKFPSPREQLPAKWVLVELPIDTPHGRKLMIVTGDWEHPIDIDPLHINCCERLPQPVTPGSYAEKLAVIEAYKKEHKCSADAAYAALHERLGHNSGEALKMWMSRNRPKGK